jgi:hypothetical protein
MPIGVGRLASSGRRGHWLSRCGSNWVLCLRAAEFFREISLQAAAKAVLAAALFIAVVVVVSLGVSALR